jgi:hypothetical protein
MREFIRHPTDIPIQYELGDVVSNTKEYLNDVSHGGLSFRSCVYLEPGSVIHINIPVHNPTFSADGIVIWSRNALEEDDHCFDIGVEFKEKRTEYGLRMIEQVCYIEHYKKEILHNEGRALSGEEAAVEWINKYAEKFPQ